MSEITPFDDSNYVLIRPPPLPYRTILFEIYVFTNRYFLFGQSCESYSFLQGEKYVIKRKSSFFYKTALDLD